MTTTSFLRPFVFTAILFMASLPLSAAVTVTELGGKVQVTWRYQDSKAKSVGLLLSTMGFNPETAIPMTKDAKDNWSVTLDSRRGQVYKFQYLVDGVVTLDSDEEKGAVDVDFALRGTPTPPIGEPVIYENETKPSMKINTSFFKQFDPALSGSLLSVSDSGVLFMGGEFQLVLAEFLFTKLSNEHPRYMKAFFDVGLYTQSGLTLAQSSLITWAFGFLASFESQKGGYRNYFIPYYGAKVGGVSITNKGSGFYLEPLVGISLIQTEAVSLNIGAGLFLNTFDLAGYLGVRSSLSLGINL